MAIQTLADITPGGVAVPLSGTAGQLATWVRISAPSANSGDVRFGDLNVSASRGAIIPKGTSVDLPRMAFAQGMYDLTKIFVFATSTDKASVTFF